MARIRGETAPGCCGDVQCDAEGCKLRSRPPGRCPGLDDEAPEADRLLQLQLRVRGIEDAIERAELDREFPLVTINYGGYPVVIPKWVYDAAIDSGQADRVPLWKD